MTSDDGMTITETPSATIARQAAEIERLREELNRTRDAIDIVADKKDAEIERLREIESNTTAAMVDWEKRWRATALENERLRQQVTQRGARMQVMREWMDSGVELMGAGAWAVWYGFVEDHPEAAEWFDEEGVPR